ncbi:MAG TPA: VWA domain-containing protein [Pyrinomonadaceae bacterium]|jgi:VWFA-related protein
MRLAALSLVAVLLTPGIGARAQQPAPDRRPPGLKGTGEAQQRPKPAPTPEPPAEVGDDEVVRVKTSLVTVPFSAVDAAGGHVVDLRREEVRVYEDGVEQRVAFFTETEQPTLVVLLLDVSGSVEPSLKRIKQAALAFIEQIRQNDYVYLVAFDHGVHPIIRQATNDKAALRAAVEAFDGWGGGTSLYAIFHLVNEQILSRVRGRRALVLFTDGVDTRSYRVKRGDTLEEAEELGFPVYTVRFPPQEGNPVFGMSPRTYLRLLAEKTGGRYFEGKDLAQARESFAAIAEELRHQYIVAYYPTAAAAPGRARRVRLKIARPGLRAQTNKTSVRVE